MKNILLLLLALSFLAACKKDDPSLTGTASEPGFSFQVTRFPGGDTLPFQSRVVFKNTSTDAFAYSWNFGDATNSVEANPTKVYSEAKVYEVTLTSVGKAGNKTLLQRVSIEGSCDYAPFSAVTGCATRSWQLSPVSDAISILSADGATTLYSGSPATCQGDDVYTFFSNGSFNYNSKGQTFVANEGPSPYSCQAPVQNAKRFYMIKNPAGNARIVLDGSGVGRNPFFGTTDIVVGNSYEVLSADEASMQIQGVLENGQLLRLKFINGFDINTLKLFLTGGSRRTWRLDSTTGANTVTAGLEANPSQYFAGGPLAACQPDDWYTFTQNDSLYVNCNGSTLIPAEGFTCGADKSFNSRYTFGNVVGSVVGLAQISLAANNPNQWIGIYDRAPENVYRIMSINNDRMLLRSGNGSATIHEIKLVRK